MDRQPREGRSVRRMQMGKQLVGGLAQEGQNVWKDCATFMDIHACLT
jgi:hypothetical protein